MYRDDLAAQRARNRTLEAELQAERAGRRAAEAKAAAATAGRDEVLALIGDGPRRRRGRRMWWLAGLGLAAGLAGLLGRGAIGAHEQVSELRAAEARLRERVAGLRWQLARCQQQARRDVLTCELPPPGARAPASESLTRSQIQAGMRRVKGAVNACYQRYRIPGLANVRLRILRDGSVGHVKIQGIFADTATGACVAGAVAAARFPPFFGEPIAITYPFVLRQS